MPTAFDYLRGLEWSMGNGQCPECHGVSEAWTGDFRYPEIENTGHKRDCVLAAAILDVGGKCRYVTKKVNHQLSIAILEREEPGFVEQAREWQKDLEAAFAAELAKSFKAGEANGKV